MQEASSRRTNAERSDAMRAALIAAARALFTAKGYADTGTPEIVAAAGVTRGALYHHFADKKALFQAVAEQEAAAVAVEVEAAAPVPQAPLDALLAGADAWLAAMQVPGRTRLLLLDGPAVLGRDGMDAIDDRHGNRTLREGLVAAMHGGAIARLPVAALVALLAAAFDRAALAIEAGAPRDDMRRVLAALIGGLAPRPGDAA